MPKTNSSCRLYCVFTASSLPTKLSFPLLEQVNLHFPWGTGAASPRQLPTTARRCPIFYQYASNVHAKTVVTHSQEVGTILRDVDCTQI